MSEWSIDKARETYSMPYWSHGYFDINADGHLSARPDPQRPEAEVDLAHLTGELRQAGLNLPVLVRFMDILRHRVQHLCQAFNTAMDEKAYEGGYTAVYPIKVNQQASVVQEILEGGRGQVGLEAGSKPELMAVMAISSTQAGVIICNGYKDREYIRLALIGQQLGFRIYLVVEKLSELEHVIREAQDLGVKPRLGVRLRLASLGVGKWQNTGGEKSKFGLSSQQVLSVVERLQAVDMLDSLELLHFHMGSQISNIRDIQKGMREASRYYTALNERGVHIRCVDVGGGLGVDYEGTRSRSFCSMNYSVQEYANNIVHALWEMCEENNLPHPDIITESGRAMTAHHAALITNVIDVEEAPGQQRVEPPDEDAPLILHDLWSCHESVGERAVLESYHDAAHWLTEARGMFTHGILSLDERARAEQYFFAICQRLRPLLNARHSSHREALDELNEILADKYFCNFSLFQSLPDVWAIQQVFPIVPLDRLDEEPARRVLIKDLTCDSDGRIDFYVDSHGIESTLPIHEVHNPSEYYLGFFMVGAYQEILGDMHNLFGDTDSVNVYLREDGSYDIGEPQQGESVDKVLSAVQFDPEVLMGAYEEAVQATGLPDAVQETYLQELAAGLRGYTYLED